MCLTERQIILSKVIAELPEGGVYLGGGEVDLKLWINVQEFIHSYNPFILDCTNPRDFELSVCCKQRKEQSRVS